MVNASAISVGWPKFCASDFSASPRPMRPLPSSNGWMLSK
jgi:hypothetical protein